MPIKSFDALAEPFKSKTLELDRLIKEKGLPFVVFETRREFKRQAELYRQGRRLQDGLMVVVDKSAIVTKAQAGESAHNWGLAVDFILDVNHEYWNKWAIKPDGAWDSGQTSKATKPNVINVWYQLGVLAKELDLEWGGSWQFRDLPHVQLLSWKHFRPSNYKAVVEREMSK
jgi:peptidoglycan LD-endopeptidase CwlK